MRMEYALQRRANDATQNYLLFLNLFSQTFYRCSADNDTFVVPVIRLSFATASLPLVIFDPFLIWTRHMMFRQQLPQILRVHPPAYIVLPSSLQFPILFPILAC